MPLAAVGHSGSGKLGAPAGASNADAASGIGSGEEGVTASSNRLPVPPTVSVAPYCRGCTATDKGCTCTPDASPVMNSAAINADHAALSKESVLK